MKISDAVDILTRMRGKNEVLARIQRALFGRREIFQERPADFIIYKDMIECIGCASTFPIEDLQKGLLSHLGPCPVCGICTESPNFQESCNALNT